MNKHISIDKSSDTPKVKQIEEQIRALIQSNTLKSGEKLPSMRRLAEQLGVSVGIAKQALNTLTIEGVLRSDPKIGVFVSNEKPMINIALVLPSVELEQIPRIVRGARIDLPENFRLLIEAPSTSFYEGQIDILKTISKTHISGIIVLTPPLRHYAPLLLAAINPGIPCVQSLFELEELKLDSVSVDGFAMGETAVSYLIRKGHRKIGLINNNADGSTFLNRIEGMNSALKSIGSSYDAMPKELTDPTHPNPDSPWLMGKEATIRLLAKYPDLTAIIGGDGHITVGVIQAIKETGRTIPDDISVIAMELDLPAFEHMDPPVTALDKPFEQVFHRSVKLLIERMDTPDKPLQSIHLAPILKERTSVKNIN
jgi:DNA-binding LacI/PurR family transcriptional regulator